MDIVTLGAALSGSKKYTDQVEQSLENNLSLKANTSDVNTATANLQTQIDQIAQAAGSGTADTEVAQARIGADGTSYQTLKARLDGENSELKEDLSDVQKRFGFVTKSIKTNSGEHSSRIDRVPFPISNGDSFYISASSIPYINKSISVYGYVEGADSGTNIGHFYNDGNDNVLVSNGDYDEIGFFYDSFGQETITRFTIRYGDSYYENLVKMSESLKGEAYVQGFELGNISISDSGWVYSEKTTRVRTKENTSISLSKGDIISLSDYSNARMYIGWKNKNGIYGTSNKWFSSPFLVAEDGEYVIVLINNPETAVSSVESLSSLVEIKRGFLETSEYACKKETIDLIETKVNEAKQGITRLIPSEYDGYVRENGTINQTTENGVKYTEKIYISNGCKIHLKGNYLTPKTRWCSIALYMSDGTFISRPVVSSGTATNMNVDYSITDSRVGYIVVSYRSYNEMTYTYDLEFNSFLSDLSKMVDSKLVLQDGKFEFRQNKNIKSINHRGYNTIAPENTLSAYRLSKKMGFDYVETDVSITSDGIPVCLHDSTIDRTSNGTGAIHQMTFEQVRQYDFGSWKSEDYVGEKIPSFEEFIILCRNLGLHPYIELKSSGNYTETDIQNCINIVKKCGMNGKVTWISFQLSYLMQVKSQSPKARLGYLRDSVTSQAIDDTINYLKSNDNEVFLNVGSYTDDDVALCIENDLPMEIWTINSDSRIISLNPYFTGISSDSINAGNVLMSN